MLQILAAKMFWIMLIAFLVAAAAVMYLLWDSNSDIDKYDDPYA